MKNNEIKEFHLFAGIGGGIYGGELLGHTCCGGVEIDEFCKKILRQRQDDGWMPKFPIYNDVTKIDGEDFKGKFDVLCGGFPCQAFSYAAHGNNIEEDIVRTGKVYERSKIDEIAPQYGRAIFSLLKEKETVTVTTGGLVVKPNGNLELLLEKTKGELADKEQKKEDHAFNRRKDYITIGVSIAAFVISVISLIVSCYSK